MDSSFPYAPGHTYNRDTTLIDREFPPLVGQRGQTMTLPCGNHEYPFEYDLPGDMAQSFSCFDEAASVTYQVQATVARGRFTLDLHAKTQLRIIRILDSDALEVLHTTRVECFSHDKLNYSIAIPQTVVTFGSCVTLKMHLTPVLKGLQLGPVTVKLMEMRRLTISTGHRAGQSYRTERDVRTWHFDRDPEANAAEDTGQDSWVLTKALTLPDSLRQCTQDLNQNGLTVSHRFRVAIGLLTPDGPVSTIYANIPVAIYLSPNFLPHTNDDAMLYRRQDNLVDQSTLTLPAYGDHILDRPYGDSDYSDSMQYWESDRDAISHDNWESSSGPVEYRAGLTSGSTTTEAASTAATATTDSAVQHFSRLSARHDSFDAESVARLKRVPSYDAALRAPVPQVGPLVPDYRTALGSSQSPSAPSLP